MQGDDEAAGMIWGAPPKRGSPLLKPSAFVSGSQRGSADLSCSGRAGCAFCFPLIQRVSQGHTAAELCFSLLLVRDVLTLQKVFKKCLLIDRRGWIGLPLNSFKQGENTVGRQV